MKLKFLGLLFTLCVNYVSGQLTITTGSALYLTGNIQLTLDNADLINNGSFVAGNSKVSFVGNTSSFINGLQPIQFYEIEVNKAGGSSVTLQRNINIILQSTFTTGFLNLNNFNLDLGTTGILNGEDENSRVIGSNGGQIILSRTLNTPSSLNAGNLGAIISSSQNLGTVTIRRGHQSQANAFGMGTSVLRYFDIIPTNNTALDATLRFQYFQGELNSLNENTLVFWKSTDNITWINQGFTSRNISSNYVEKTGIASFSRWTLSSVNNPLPVQFSLFNVKCEGNINKINWTTANEMNSSHFIVERSSDGNQWTTIGKVKAVGNSNVENKYSFTDNVSSGYYRIAQFDLDGSKKYTGILRSSCLNTDLFSVFPNPVTSKAVINMQAGNNSQASIKIFDSKGSLIKTQMTTLLSGSNQVYVDMEKLSGGVYQMVVEWGGKKKTVRVVKQ